MLGDGLYNSGTQGSWFKFQFASLSMLEELSRQVTTRVDEVGAPAISYVGTALPGSAETSPVWRIKRITLVAGITTILYADGNTVYDNKWSNRAALTYA